MHMSVQAYFSELKEKSHFIAYKQNISNKIIYNSS